MRENKAGYQSKAHLYVPQHADRGSVGHQDLFKKMIKERKDESESDDSSLDS